MHANVNVPHECYRKEHLQHDLHLHQPQVRVDPIMCQHRKSNLPHPASPVLTRVPELVLLLLPPLHHVVCCLLSIDMHSKSLFAPTLFHDGRCQCDDHKADMHNTREQMLRMRMMRLESQLPSRAACSCSSCTCTASRRFEVSTDNVLIDTCDNVRERKKQCVDGDAIRIA